MLLTEAGISEVIKIYLNKDSQCSSTSTLTFARFFPTRGFFFCCLAERLGGTCTNTLYIWSLVSAGLKNLARFKIYFQKNKSLQLKNQNKIPGF